MKKFINRNYISMLMEEKYYLVKDIDGKLSYSSCYNFKDNKGLKNLSQEIRIKILKELNNSPMYPSKLASKMGLNEQKLYYHINQMHKAGIIEISEKKEIRGTIAKRFKPIDMNFSLSLSNNWSSINNLIKPKSDDKFLSFFEGFLENGVFSGEIIVGSPDPHGPFKARARDGHFAIDLSFFLGNHMNLPIDFTTKLDVDIKLKYVKKNLILVGGPVTNQLVSQINNKLPVNFAEGKNWGIRSSKTKKKFTDETTGLIARIENPFNDKYMIIVVAGISASGTKSAVLALTRSLPSLLQSFTGQKSFGTIINGFDLDGDGKVDSIEILE